MSRRGIRRLVLLLVAGFAIGMSIALVVWRIPIVRTLNSVNPMLLNFLVRFDVVNESGEDISFVPVGMAQSTGLYVPLPMYDSTSAPALPIDRSGPVTLPRGATASVIYDWDDVNFRHLLIVTQSGKVLLLDTDRAGTLRTCYAAKRTRYAIPSLSQLSPAPPELEPLLRGKRVQYADAKEYP